MRAPCEKYRHRSSTALSTSLPPKSATAEKTTRTLRSKLRSRSLRSLNSFSITYSAEKPFSALDWEERKGKFLLLFYLTSREVAARSGGRRRRQGRQGRQATHKQGSEADCVWKKGSRGSPRFYLFTS